MSRITEHKLFEIFKEKRGRRIFTKNLVRGRAPFAERLVRDKGTEYREFDPTRSKLAASIMKGSLNIGIKQNDVVLYLGVAHGYTASYISDMIGENGLLFGIDPATRVVRDLVFLSNDRKNIVPILANANKPNTYSNRICQADIIIQDVSQKNQLEIFRKNVNTFLKKGGYGLLAIKARSIDMSRNPKEIFIEFRKQLEREYTVIDYRILDPFEKDHCMIIIKNQ
jgi:fibrillarin-like pre-rRNA processing protein